MKQHITVKQLKELSESQCDKLLEWLLDKGYERELSIGQLIEFLREHDVYFCIDSDKPVEPVDTLWEAVKEILNG